jgi:predicted ArsR family transcriptional regulator
MTGRMADLASRIIELLKPGPRTAAEVADTLRHSRVRVSECIQRLRHEGIVKRHDHGRSNQGAVWALAVKPERRQLRNAAYRDLEERYTAARMAGARADDLAAAMGLTKTTASTFEDRLYLQTQGHASPDTSTPKFAYHDEHLAGVLKHGGFCAFSQRQSGFEPAICKPVIWPARAA